MLAADSLTAKKTQIQHTTSLLDQLCHLSAALQEVREQRHELFEQQQTLHEQLQALYAQQQTVHKQEARMLEEYSSVLTQLASLRERGFSQNF
jgi:uncharacterized coiled-coil DUF342 family protein